MSIIEQHVLNGCDQNAGFYGIRKKLKVEGLYGLEEAHNLLVVCGRQLPATGQVLDDLEQCVICFVYCDLKHNTLTSEGSKVEGAEEKNAPFDWCQTQIVYTLTWSMQTISNISKAFPPSKLPLFNWPWRHLVDGL